MPLSLVRALKCRWRQVTVVLTAPFVLGCLLWWGTEDRPRTAGIGPGSWIRPPPPPAPPLLPAPLSLDTSLDRGEQIQQVREQLAEQRTAAAIDSAGLGRLLLQLAKLESADGNDEAAAAAYREI